MLKKIMMVLTIVLLFTVETNAQTGMVSRLGLGIGPQVGYQKAGDADDGRFMFGAALRLRLTQALGAEASLSYRQEKYGNEAVTVKSWPVMISGMFYPIPFAYGVLGGGWYNTTFDYNENIRDQINVAGINLGDETVSSFGWHLGAGLEIDAGSTMKLVGDIRYVFLNYEFDNLAEAAILNDVNANFYVITVGLLFGF